MTVTYYVVHKGRVPGIYKTWSDCKKQIDKFEGAIFKKFDNTEDANNFLEIGFGEGKKPRSVVRKENDDKKNNDKIVDEIDDENALLIYTDGSCIKVSKNLSKAGFGIYIPEKNIKVSSPLLNQKITNNRAELTAIIESVKYLDEADSSRKICIFTDSQYSMYIFNGTGQRYMDAGFKNDGKDVPNIDLIKKILELKPKYNIVLLKVRAHTDKKDKHSIGNAIADKLAGDGAMETTSGENNIFKITSNENSIFKPIDTSIDKDISVNNLFEFDENNDGKKITSKSVKNLKLSKWFIKV